MNKNLNNKAMIEQILNERKIDKWKCLTRREKSQKWKSKQEQKQLGFLNNLHKKEFIPKLTKTKQNKQN